MSNQRGAFLRDCHCTDTKLAVLCLWHLTFYGYIPKEQKEEAKRYFEREESERRNVEIYLADNLYDDEYVKEERKQLEQEAALKMELRKKAEQ